MAISTDLPGVTIALTIKNQELPEQDFPDLDPEERTINRLVEAQSQQVFQVQMTVAPDTIFKGTELAFKVFVDGRQIDEPLVNVGVLGMGFPFIEISLGSHVSERMVRKYQFADISAVEQQSHSISSRSRSVRNTMSSTSADSPRMSASSSNTEDHIMTPMTSVSGMSEPRPVSYTGGPSIPSSSMDGHVPSELLELGTIKVEVRHVTRKKPVGFGPGGGVCRSFGTGARNEAQRRNITQRVGFTAPAPTTTVQVWSVDDVSGVENPAATFIFHYRSKEGLESMLALAAQSLAGLTTREEEVEEKPIKLEPIEEAAEETAAQPALRRSSRLVAKQEEEVGDTMEFDGSEEGGEKNERDDKVEEG